VRMIHLMGGNAAGKTTLLDALAERWRSVPAYRFLHGDGGLFGGDKTAQFRVLMRLWSDKTAHTLVLEGTRVYSAVFRCAKFNVTPRTIYLGLMLQRYEDGVEHLKMRCAKRGKTYRGDFWGRGDDEVGHLFHDRYAKAVAKLQREYPGLVDPAHVQTFWIDPAYAAVQQARTWADGILEEGQR